MQTIRLILITSFCLLVSLLHASETSHLVLLPEDFQGLQPQQIEQIVAGPGPLQKFLKKKYHLNRKFTAAALAFPFPFGIVGLHRIYLGCAPYVPVVYIASLGGAFGLIPLIDFIVILTEKDVERFANSGKVFMWVE